jgi:cell division protein FtsL
LESQVLQLQDQILQMQSHHTTASSKADQLAEKVADLTRKERSASLELAARQKQIRDLTVIGWASAWVDA